MWLAATILASALTIYVLVTAATTLKATCPAILKSQPGRAMRIRS